MKGKQILRMALATGILILALAWALPSFLGKDSKLRKILPEDEISYGLDLKGGIHLTLEVDIPKAVEYALNQAGEDIKFALREKKAVITGLRVNLPEENKEGRLHFTLVREVDEGTVDNFLEDNYAGSLSVVSRTVGENGRVAYTLAITPRYRDDIEFLTVEQAVKTIRNRIDGLGLKEPDIRKMQGDRIQVQLPGYEDSNQAKELIGRTAHLEFKLVADGVDPALARGPQYSVHTLKGYRQGGTYTKQQIVLHNRVLLTGEYVSDANLTFDRFGNPYVSLSFNPAGARKFAKITGENINKRLAIVLDGEVYSAPNIGDRIAGGHAQITGSFKIDEARDLAVVLRSGSLPAPVKIIEERFVGPSLGQDSIDKGKSAALVGLALVLVFLLIYYGIGGVVANAVLLFNLLLIMASLAAFGATLTLPGIAGIILTIGMAVDANVIIFERIREEIRAGLTIPMAVAEGYRRATLTILDANLTTILAAVILYQFGTGPVRGFAVTLSLGILASMFTAIFVSRIIFNLLPQKINPVAGLSFMKSVTKFDFLGRRKLAFTISALVLILGVGSVVMHKGLKYGVDFAGGITIQMQATKSVDIEKFKAAVAETGLKDVQVQSFGSPEDNEYLVRIAEQGLSTAEAGSTLIQAAKAQMPETDFEIQRQEMVGPKVGADLREKAMEAFFFAVLLIAIYISGRFEARWGTAVIMGLVLGGSVWVLLSFNVPVSLVTLFALVLTIGLCWHLRLNYALGAVVALIHDVAITVGIFSLLGKEFDLTIVAALLTIVGYSLNDTIIVFDRIRENLRGKKKLRFKEIINLSVNQTLSRTLLTSGTTLLVLFALYLFGGGIIHDFALALVIGVGVGTYSSIFVATPILLGVGPSKIPEDDVLEQDPVH